MDKIKTELIAIEFTPKLCKYKKILIRKLREKINLSKSIEK